LQFTTDAIKSLREQTSAGLMDCKRALTETKGDIAAAADILMQRGFAIAEKKADRVAAQGLIESYVHTGGKIAALVEVNCESDFVARTPEFKELAHDLAMQVAATNPKFIAIEDAPEEENPSEEDCLLLQQFIKDPKRQVKDVITEAISKIRENIRVKRFTRFEMGIES